MTYRGDNPTTPGQLYDLLHTWFGFGVYDEDDPDPWYMARAVEVGKLGRLINGRRTSVRQMHITAKYCRDHKVALRGPAGLFFHMQPALDAHRNAQAEAKAAETRAEIEAAIEWEREHRPDSDRWLGQLLRAQDPEAQKEVLHRWKLSRQRYKNAR